MNNKPRLLIKTKDLEGNVDGIDYIEMLNIPYNFQKLHELLVDNIQDIKNLVDDFERSGWFESSQIEDFRTIIDTVIELNESWMTERVTQ